MKEDVDESNGIDAEQSKELDDKRSHVLLTLSTTRDNVDGQNKINQASRISCLKKENNLLVDERLKITSKARPKLGDPSSLLPVEIFAEIVDLIFCDTFLVDWSIEGLLSLTLVSTRWRDILMSIPGLWRHIRLKDSDTFYFQEKLSIALLLSGNAPLVLWLRPPLYHWEETIDKLRPHFHRIIELLIDLSHDNHAATAPPTVGRVANILDQMGSLPSLKRLRCTSWIGGDTNMSDVTRFIERHPQLEEIAGVWLTKEFLNTNSIKKVTSFRTRQRPPSVLPHLNRMKILSKVTFDHYGLYIPPMNNEDEVDVDMSQYPSLPLQWTYYSQVGPPAIPLLSGTTATLLKLKLHTTLSEAPNLFQILHEFQKLQTLYLYLEVCPIDPMVVPPSPLQKCTSLQTTWIDFSSTSFSFPAAPHAHPNDWGPIFARMVRQFFGHIKDVNMSAYTLDAKLPWDLVDSSQFESLETLSLSLSEGQDIPPDGFQLPVGLESLDISGMHYHLPNLSSTTVTSLVIDSFRAPKTPTTLNPEFWPSITELSIPPSAIGWSGECFKHLRSIDLEVDWDEDWDYTTQFCRDLALHPEYIPVLQQIHFSGPPEWDILCILLERYNFRTGSEDTRISSISFGGDVPFYLLDPIKDLCAGKFVDRPSNFDLSWVSNMDIIYDQNLPGCMKCIKTLLSCHISRKGSSPTTRHADYVFPFRRTHRDADAISDYCLDILMDLPLEDGMIDPVEFRMRKLPVPVYPATEDEILATWNEREEVWKMLKKGTDGSVCSGWCRRRVLITEEKGENAFVE
ncbi:hypothetical protein FS842_002831 [Serendipita sp. 407]|nr:hypothetical protein FS842_002831 [Serendipita sp. 407]